MEITALGTPATSFDVLRHEVASHPLLRRVASGELSRRSFVRLLWGFAPVVFELPRLIRMAGERVEAAETGGTRLKQWLRHKSDVELNRARWYRHWVRGMSESSGGDPTPPPSVTALVEFLWHLEARGNLAESMAALHLGAEWGLRQWSLVALQVHPQRRDNREQVRRTERTEGWLRACARHSERHPAEAKLLIRGLLTTKAEVRAAKHAASESLRYFKLALDLSHREVIADGRPSRPFGACGCVQQPRPLLSRDSRAAPR